MFKKAILICLSAFIVILVPFFSLKADTIIPDLTHISENTIWTTDNSPYIIKGRITIDKGATLTIEPGVIIKFKPGSGAQIQIWGNLKAEGKEDAKIIFTSLYDDTYGGDTNNDGSLTSPQPGNWNSLSFVSTSNIGILDNVIVAYGGLRPGIVAGSIESISNNNLIITNSAVKDSGNYGVLLYYSQVRIENNKIINNKVGIFNWDSYRSIVKNNIISGNNTGVFTYNPLFAQAIDAIGNWWGDPSGPYHPTLNPKGNGNRVGDKVLFNPWLDKEPHAEPSIDPLILKYEPILYFHPEEDFYPMNVEPFVEHSSLWDSHGLYEVDELLKDESDENPVILDDLTPVGQDTANWYLQFSQDLQDKTPDPVKANTEYQELVSLGQAKPTYYARKMEDSYTDEDGIAHNFIVLQYWYFYAMNDWQEKVGGLASNNHEGDWESVMVFLDKDTEEPRYAAYSAHHNVGEENFLVGSFDSVRRNWNSNEIVKTEGRIVSFVGLGSHASYPNNGENGIHKIPTLLLPDDQTSNLGIHLGDDSNQWLKENIVVFNESSLPDWLSFYEGKWGVDYFNDFKDRFSGPQGPFYQNKFNHPIQWAGIDKIKEQQLQAGENVIETDTAILTVVTNEQGQITVDYHNEIPPFSESETHILFPHFWDITSTDLANGEFRAEVSFIYNPEEMQVLGITNPARLTVFVYDETGQIWQEVPSTVDINNNIIKFQTDHFSRYAIGIKKIQFQEITDKIKIIENKKHYDKKTGIQEIDFKIKNNSPENIKGMLLLSISDLAQGIEFVNPDDLTSLSLISTGLPENLQAVDFTDSYRYCLFIGAESDIPTTVNKRTKNRLLLEKPIKEKRCSEISSTYPELSLFLENVLPAHKFTEDKILQFKVPTKKDKKFDYEVRLWNVVGS